MAHGARGVGNLGKAILNHGEFRARGFNIVGIFDCDPFKIGEIVHGLEVHCTKDLKAMVPSRTSRSASSPRRPNAPSVRPST